MRLICIYLALIVGLTVLIESDNQVGMSVSIECADESQACEDALEDLQGGMYE